MHAFHNAIFLGIPLILMPEVSEVLNINSKSFTLKVEEIYQKPTENKLVISGNTIIIKNLSLKTAISTFLDIDEFRIRSNDDPFLEKKLNLDFKNLTKDELKIKKAAIDEIAKLYNFKIVMASKLEDAWELYVSDSLLLSKNVADSIITGSLSISEDEVNIKNSNIESLASGISSKTKKTIINKSSTSKKYNIRVQVKDFEKLKNQLNTQYGLSLKKTKKDIEHVNVQFSLSR